MDLGAYAMLKDYEQPVSIALTWPQAIYEFTESVLDWYLECQSQP